MTTEVDATDRSARPGRRRRRDRHGRGRRGVLAPPDVPIARTRAEQFDDLVLDAVEDLEQTLGDAGAEQLRRLQFAVEDVPGPVADEFSPDVVADHGVVLAQLLRDGLPAAPEPPPTNRRERRDRARRPAAPEPAREPVLLIYRRPVEARTDEGEDRGDLVFSVVVELVAEWLGRDVEEIDPR